MSGVAHDRSASFPFEQSWSRLKITNAATPSSIASATAPAERDEHLAAARAPRLRGVGSWAW